MLVGFLAPALTPAGWPLDIVPEPLSPALYCGPSPAGLLGLRLGRTARDLGRLPGHEFQDTDVPPARSWRLSSLLNNVNRSWRQSYHVGRWVCIMDSIKSTNAYGFSEYEGVWCFQFRRSVVVNGW